MESGLLEGPGSGPCMSLCPQGATLLSTDATGVSCFPESQWLRARHPLVTLIDRSFRISGQKRSGPSRANETQEQCPSSRLENRHWLCCQHELLRVSHDHGFVRLPKSTVSCNSAGKCLVAPDILQCLKEDVTSSLVTFDTGADL